MTIEELQPYINELRNYDKLCIFHNETKELLDTLYINPKDHKLYEYYNLFSSHEIEDDDRYYFFKHIKSEDVHIEILPVEQWCGYLKKRNYDWFMESLKSDENNNAKLIYEEIKKDQGKYITFTFGGKSDLKYAGILLSIAVSDDDYYYVYLDGNNEIQEMTCVSGYRVTDENYVCKLTSKEIGKMLTERFDTENSMEALIYRGKYDI